MGLHTEHYQCSTTTRIISMNKAVIIALCLAVILASASASFKLKENIYLRGRPIMPGGNIYRTTVDVCKRKCAANPKCVAFQFMKRPGFGRCSMKAAVSSETVDNRDLYDAYFKV